MPPGLSCLLKATEAHNMLMWEIQYGIHILHYVAGYQDLLIR